MIEGLSHRASLAITLVPILGSIITIYRMWMIRSKDPMRYRCAVLHKRGSGLVIALCFKSIRQVFPARQRVGVLRSKYLLRGLHYLHLHLFRLLLSTLITLCRCEIVHARQRGWMLHHLHSQLLRLIPPSLITVCRCEPGDRVKISRNFLAWVFGNHFPTGTQNQKGKPVHERCNWTRVVARALQQVSEAELR